MLKQYRNLPFEVYIICFGILLTNLGSYVFPLFVYIASDFGYAYSDISLFLALFTLANMVGAAISGQLIDHFGRKQTFTIFMFLSGLMFVLLPLSNRISFVVLVVLGQIFMGVSRPAARVMLVDLTGQDKRKAALSLWYIMLNVGFSFGPAIGAFLYNYNVNLLYLGDGITTMMFALLIAFLVKETKPSQEQIDTHDIRGEEKVEGNVFSVFRVRPELLYLMLFSVLFQFTYCQFNFGLPATTDMVKGETLGPIVFGIIMTINGVTVTFVTPIITRLFQNKRPSLGLILSGFFMGIGFAINGFISAPFMFYIAAFIWSCGEALWIVNYIAYETNHTPISHRGRIGTFMHNMYSAIRMGALYISGLMIERVSLQTFWIIMPLFAIIASLVAIRLYQFSQAEKDTAAI